MKVIILQYRGVSLISRLIRWQTRSVYSHSAVMLDDCSIVESWQRGGVSRVNGPYDNHSVETIIDRFSIEMTAYQFTVFKDFLLAQVGKKYDFLSVLRFITRSGHDNKERWFCSELVVAALNQAGIYPLERIEASAISPGMLVLSPMLKREHLRL